MSLLKMKTYLSFITVEPVLFLYMMLIFLETNTLQSLIRTKVCLTEYELRNCTPKASKNLTDLAEVSSTWVKYCSACLFFSTFLISFYVASWSDYLGRKIIMLIPPIGSFVAAVINICLSVFLEAHIAFFFISALVSGFTFGTVGIIASTFGFLSDITTEETRTKRIIILEAMIFTGGTLGIYIGGAIIDDVDLNITFNRYAAVFTLELCIATSIFFYVLLRIPKRASNALSEVSTRCLKLFSISHLKDVFRAVAQKREGRKRMKILLLLLALIFVYWGSAVQFTLAYLFVTKEPLKWTMTEYSYYYCTQFALEGVALLIGIPSALHFYHVPDCIVALIGMVSRIAGFLLFGLSTTKAMMFSCAVLFMFSEFPVPTARSMLSKIVDESERGKIFAFTTILQNLCYLSASLVLNTVFEKTTKYFPGLCFEIVAGLQGFAFIIFCILYCIDREVVTVYETFQNAEQGNIEERNSTVVVRGDEIRRRQ